MKRVIAKEATELRTAQSNMACKPLALRPNQMLPRRNRRIVVKAGKKRQEI